MAENGRKILSGVVRTAVKLGIAATVICWLYHRHSDKLSDCLENFDTIYLIPVILLTLTAAFTGMLRWKYLTTAADIELPLAKAVSLTMQGIFFSLVIPGGAIGGDVVKMAALSGHIRPGTRTEGFFSVIIDRITGMFALFLLALLILGCSTSLFDNLNIAAAPMLSGRILQWLLVLICLAGIASGCALFFHRKLEKLSVIRKIIDFADRKSKGKASRISLAADAYTAARNQVLFWIVITIFFVHLLPAFSMYLLLIGTGVSPEILPVAAAVVIGNIAGLIPLFPGGIGARDAVTIALLTAGGIPAAAAAAAQLISTIITIIFNLFGAIFFIADQKNISAAAK